MVDNANAVISFITPAPGVNLRLYVDHYVGVNGQRGYMTDLQKQHINVQRVTVLDGASPPPWVRVVRQRVDVDGSLSVYVAVDGELAAAVLFAIIVRYGIRLFLDDWNFDTTSPGIGIPQWMYTIWLPLLSAVIALRIVPRADRVRTEGR